MQKIAAFALVIFIVQSVYTAVLFELLSGYPIGKTSRGIWHARTFFLVYLPSLGFFSLTVCFSKENAGKIHSIAAVIKYYVFGVAVGLLCVVVVALLLRVVGVLDDELATNMPAIIRYIILVFLGLSGGAMVYKFDNEIQYLWHNSADSYSDTTEKKSKRENHKKSSPPPPPPPESDELKNALELFEIKQPFTAKELSQRRRALLGKTHPDGGGSAYLFKQVDVAYEVLKPHSKG